ncbi:hypothetical protein [Gryllotalpicola protaetiae]|uniref:Uncharacterized protein n=1 Tax=Gryllotalpicola protaetiae TaxID=2419771 RepID=A0A387BYI7_9MICO|nr:hypothetical protein [Gryllotalpicola protaetiae]AYG03411.1 hypothetical protein D7I44_07600 [Gryllotalpicola protaetiae]
MTARTDLDAFGDEDGTLAPGISEFYVEWHGGFIVDDSPATLVERLTEKHAFRSLRFSASWSPEAQRIALRSWFTDWRVLEWRRRSLFHWLRSGHTRDELDRLPADVRKIVTGRYPRAWIRPSVPWSRDWPLLVATQENLTRLEGDFGSFDGRTDGASIPVIELRSSQPTTWLRSLRYVTDGLGEVGILIDDERVPL